MRGTERNLYFTFFEFVSDKEVPYIEMSRPSAAWLLTIFCQ